MFNRLNFSIIPVQIFLFVFWFKNGFIDKVCGIALGIITPETAYKGDTWAGWESYIVGTWDKSEVGHAVLSPFFAILFPILIALQCLPFVLALVSIVKGEFLTGEKLKWLERSAIASLFVTSAMLFSQTLSGASDGQYLWQLLGFGMVLLMYIKNRESI
ncbi:hypothetical protein [Photobacterium damselae]|uniref:hypothetical protein n=1 Tax=Photobacterium damselae TaxID=38293 RepID=UPI001F1F8874|nr:hypothetical protein [Photobacterium damselae]UKA12899.1 hypothetical protein IHC91_21515 [Photobacterium damselae subsp. damselae]